MKEKKPSVMDTPNRRTIKQKKAENYGEAMMEQYRKTMERLSEISGRIENNHADPFHKHLMQFRLQ